MEILNKVNNKNNRDKNNTIITDILITNINKKIDQLKEINQESDNNIIIIEELEVFNSETDKEINNNKDQTKLLLKILSQIQVILVII